MEFVELISNLIIGPLKLLFEIVFAFASRFFENPGYSIIFLSLAMNFLVLPLYKRADEIQNKQRQIDEKVKPMADHIKKSFKGDERFMMLQTYYRQNNYSQFGMLKSSVSLLLQIPFFLAAYQMLSGLQLLQGVKFGFITNLGAPDQMINIGNISINILPILMTIINIVSGVIYTKGMSKQNKIQLFGIAAIFLVLLYNSPAGLVFYWTLNNAFSLCKNIFYKLKNSKLIIGVIASISGVFVFVLGIFVHPVDTTKKQIAIILFSLLLQLPIIAYFFAKNKKASKEIRIDKKDNISFFLGGLLMSVLTGLLIPSALVNASTVEFINTQTLLNPLNYVLNCFMLSLGTFVIWCGIFYALVSNKGKRLMRAGMWIIVGMSIVNYMFFDQRYGNINPRLGFDTKPKIDIKEQIFNIAIIAVLVLLLYMIWKVKPSFTKFAYSILCVVIAVMSIINISSIQKEYTKQVSNLDTMATNEIELPISKNGKNVVIMMMDRAVGCYLPYILNEKPELSEKLAGFTYYPNTISYGAHTNFASPALFGGYDYTPENLNKRSKELLVNKQNESLKVLPNLFHNAGYEVTVSDPPYAGYSMWPDVTIYDNEFGNSPDFHRFVMMGNIDTDVSNLDEKAANRSLNRNFFCYSIFKIAPLFLQQTVYTNGAYNNPDQLYAQHHTTSLPSYRVATTQQVNTNTSAVGHSYLFLRAYYALDKFNDVTKISDTNKPSFIMITNDTTHEPQLLQTPNYVPQNRVDNTEYYKAHKDDYIIDGKRLDMDDIHHATTYHVNMCGILKLVKWIDYLRANDVYDNTRIIVVADHGDPNQLQYDGLTQYNDEPLMGYNPLLMVKDFGSKNSGIITDNQFMTNADVPTIALNGVVQNPINPYTHNPINSDAKNGNQHICISHNWNTKYNNGTHFIEFDSDGNVVGSPKWLSVHDNIFDTDNWSTYESKY